MSTARKVLMIIACILALLLLIGFAFMAIYFFVSIGDDEALQRMLDGLNRPSMSLKEGKVFVSTLGVMFIVLAFIVLINAGLAIRGKDSNRNGLMILNIIFGVLSGVGFNSLGGVFGLIERKKETK
jgi:hypothetical protein